MHWLIRKKLLLEEKKHSYKLQHKLSKLSIFSRYNKKRYSCKICKLSTQFVNFVTLLKKTMSADQASLYVLAIWSCTFCFVFLLWRWERGEAVISPFPLNTSIISLSICYIVDKEPRNIWKEVVWHEQKIGQQKFSTFVYMHLIWTRSTILTNCSQSWCESICQTHFLYLNILATLSILKLLYCLKL